MKTPKFDVVMSMSQLTFSVLCYHRNDSSTHYAINSSTGFLSKNFASKLLESCLVERAKTLLNFQ